MDECLLELKELTVYTGNLGILENNLKVAEVLVKGSKNRRKHILLSLLPFFT